MVTIRKEGADFVFEVQGMHKVWAFKNTLTIPASHIKAAYQDAAKTAEWPGWKFPGTNVPFVLTAGTYFHSNEKTFWDVRHKDKCIVIDLADEDYDHLIIEVADPQEAIALLQS